MWAAYGDFLSRVQYGKGGKVILQWRNLANTTLAGVKWSRLKWSAVTSHIDRIYPSYDVMRMTLYPCGLSPHPITPHLIMKKKIREIPTEEHSTKHLISTPQYIKFVRNNEYLRNCHSQKEPKEIWQINVMWLSWWKTGTEKEY